MELRDYFAGQVISGFAARMTSEDRRRYRDGHTDRRDVAAAYAIADAMVEEGLKGPIEHTEPMTDEAFAMAQQQAAETSKAQP